MESRDSIFWCFSSLVCIHLVTPATQPAFPTALPSPWHWNPTRPASTQWEACGDFNQVGKDGWRPLPEKNHNTPEAISILNVINVLNHTDLSRKCVPLILGMLLAKHNYKTSAILHKQERIPHSKLLIFPVHLHPLSAITLANFLCEASPKSQESDHSKLAKKWRREKNMKKTKNEN